MLINYGNKMQQTVGYGSDTGGDSELKGLLVLYITNNLTTFTVESPFIQSPAD